MTQYEKNIKVLSKYYPNFDELIENGIKEIRSELLIKKEQADDGGTILKIQKDGKYYYLNGKRDSKEPAEIWRKMLGKLEQNAPVIMMGTGNPSYFMELVEHTENRVTIIVYEPSIHIFLKFLEMVDLEPWMDKHLIVFWINGLENMDLKTFRNIINKTLLYEMLIYTKYLILPNYDILFPEEALEFVKTCRDIAIQEVIQYNTNVIFSKVMVQNLLSNSRYLCDGYKTTQLVGIIPNDVPGILVAAGPSLNNNIKDLKQAHGKSFIIAVDTAVKPLLREGIIPDMLVIIDGMKPLELFHAEGVKEIPLLASLSAASEVLDYHTGMKFFYNQGYQFAERIFQESDQIAGGISSGGSVATNAFSLLYKIGLETIILVGQDLAYTNNRSHADGTFKEVMEENDTSNFMMVEGNCEDQVPTVPSFKIYIDWYNNYIKGCKECRQKIGKKLRVINATEGGAKIEGTEIMTLKKAISEVCTKQFDAFQAIKELKPMLTEDKREWAKRYLVDIPSEFRLLSTTANKVNKLYIELDKICGRRNLDQKVYLKIMKKIKKGIREITKMSTYQLLNMAMTNANYILSSEQFLSENTLQKEGKEIARKGIIYMKNVEKLATAFEEYATEIFRELSCGGEEIVNGTV